MFSVCGNPNGRAPFDYRRGRFFSCFHKDHPPGQKLPNTHSVQYFWMCGACCRLYMLEYQNGRGVLLGGRQGTSEKQDLSRLIAAA